MITLPLLEGLDGVNKMSKSLGNYIGINESPEQIFGKVMSISDELMSKYYELLTEEDLTAVRSLHPKEAKENLARIIISQYHGSLPAQKPRMSLKRFLKIRKSPLTPRNTK